MKMKFLKPSKRLLSACLILIFVTALPGQCSGEEASEPVQTKAVGTLPAVGDLIKFVDQAAAEKDEGKEWSTPVKMVIIFAGLAILPSLMVMMTSFTRIVIVLSFIRKAVGTQNIPPNIAIMGLALFLSVYTMTPTFSAINEVSLKPYLAEAISLEQAGELASAEMKGFMLRQCRENDLALFVEMAETSAFGYLLAHIQCALINSKLLQIFMGKTGGAVTYNAYGSKRREVNQPFMNLKM